jgi:Lon protease-like protein
MSDYRLPIFPLGVVVFPGTTQPLHIFEPRYRQLLADVLAGDRRFGISYVEAEPEADPTPGVGEVGCRVLVRASAPLAGGRSNVLTVGEERYVLRAYLETDKPYLVAEVESFDDSAGPEVGVGELAERVRDQYVRVADAVTCLADAARAPVQLSADAKELSFQVAAGLPVDGATKQRLLVVASTRERLALLHRISSALATDLTPRAEVHRRARRNGKGGGAADITVGTP